MTSKPAVPPPAATVLQDHRQLREDSVLSDTTAWAAEMTSKPVALLPAATVLQDRQ